MAQEGICDGNCNECPIINHENSRMLTLILNECDRAFGDKFYQMVQKNCPNLTVCHTCRMDDFCHNEGCAIVNKIPKNKKREW